MTLKYIIYREDKYYVAQCLNVDVSSFGESIKKAQNSITIPTLFLNQIVAIWLLSLCHKIHISRYEGYNQNFLMIV